VYLCVLYVGLGWVCLYAVIRYTVRKLSRRLQCAYSLPAYENCPTSSLSPCRINPNPTVCLQSGLQLFRSRNGCDSGLATALLVRVISFELTQHIRPLYIDVTDGRTDRRTDGRLTIAIPRFVLGAKFNNINFAAKLFNSMIMQYLLFTLNIYQIIC